MTKVSEFLKTAEAASFLGISQNTLRAWAKAGQIPVRRNPANGYRLFRRSDLKEFLARLGRVDRLSQPSRKNTFDRPEST